MFGFSKKHIKSIKWKTFILSYFKRLFEELGAIEE